MQYGNGDCMIERDHGAGSHTFQQFVQGQDLRPICIFRSRCFVMNRSTPSSARQDLGLSNISNLV